MGIADPPRAKGRPDGERKEIRMKRALCLFFAILLAFSFTGCVFTPSHAYPAATFERDGLTLTLTEAFSFADPAPEGMTFAMESTQVVVFVRKEAHLLPPDDPYNPIPMTVHVRDYVLALREANSDKNPSEVLWDSVRVSEEDSEPNIVYYFYYATADDYTYFVTAVLGTDVAYTVEFVTRTSTFQTYRSHLAEWTAKAKAE
jgi:hypothetical protein